MINSVGGKILPWTLEGFELRLNKSPSTLHLRSDLVLGKRLWFWSLTLREESKLRVSENMVLRRIFGPRRDEVTGEWRRLHNEELNDLYCSPNIVRV